MKMLLTVLSLCLGISFTYDLSCPDVSQWSIRARLLCPDPSKYYCLWDGNAKVFKENCSKVDLTRAGERLVIQYNFDSKFCPKDVYQPYIHFTNESSGCLYKKSLCDEEGQVVYDDTDTKHDIKCTCDYTRGYDFITKPNDPCYCIPSEEDCSCYHNPCMMPELESDSRCTNTTKLSNQNNCAPLTNSSEKDTEKTRPIMRNDEQAMETVSELDRLNVQTAMVFVGCIIPIIGLSVIIVIIVHKFKFRKVVIRKPELQIVCIEHHEFTLKCEISNSNSEVNWFKDAKILSNTKKSQQSFVAPLHSLTIKDMSKDDEGQYELRYRNKTLTETHVRILCVISKPELEIICIANDEFTLKCELSNTNSEVNWYKGDQILSNTKKTQQSFVAPLHSLTIKHMSKDDEGQYELRYRNKTLTETHILFLYVITEPPLKIICNDKFTLRCEISKSISEVNWYKDDQIVSYSKNIVHCLAGCKYSLIIKYMSEDDEGQYELRYKDKTLTKTDVQFKFVIREPEHEITCIEDGTFTLKCEIYNSSLKVYWYKDDPIDVGTTNIHQSSDGPLCSLTIVSMSKDDEGKYELRYGKRTLTETHVCFQPFVISKPLSEIICIEEYEFNLKWEIATSDVEVCLYKNDQCLPDTTQIKRSSDGRNYSLTIKHMSKDDEGQYELRYRKKILTTTFVRFDFALDKKKKAEHLDNIKTKTEKRFYIRVMIVGEHGVGKSSLLMRLLGEGIQGVKSTDGIDIVVRRCKIRLSDGKWIFHGDPDPKRLYASRVKHALQQINVDYEVPAMEMTTIDQKTYRGPTQYSAHEVQEEVQNIVTAEDKPSGQPKTFASEEKTNTTQGLDKPSKPTGSLTSTRKVTKVLIDKVEQELEHFLSHIDKYENENEEYVEIGFWDFAGDKDYYGTHYTFLDPHALYLLVTDCSDELKQTETCVTYDSIGECVDFWFDAIHSCNDVEEENTDGYLDPPIIAVCTGLDKLTKPVNKKKEQYRMRYKDAIQYEQKGTHLRDICFVSNSKPSDADFNRLRDLIFEYGKRLISFGETLPLKWIRLEQALNVLRESGLNIVSRYDVIDLSTKCDFNEQEREIQVEQFLKHQHKNGSIIYNSDINDFVILSQQWLANAFKCLVSNKIDSHIQLSDEWEKLEKTGILEMSLITKLFKKEPKLKFDKYQKHIIDVLNKFDIIGINYEEGRPLYYMPYMITSSYSPSLSVIFKTFGVSHEECKQTPWLCLEFDFFPLAFFTHVMLYYVRNYTMCFDSKLNKPSIYQGVGVFFLDVAPVNKLIVVFCKNTIAIQVWSWDPVAEHRYIEIISEITKVIDSLKMRYEGHKLRYTVKVKCSDGDVNSQTGRIRNRDLLDKSRGGKYFCNEHYRYHDSSQLFNTWFYKYSDDFSRAEESKTTTSDLSLITHLQDWGWLSALKPEFEMEYFKQLEVLLKKDYNAGVQVFPPKDLIFNAFNKTPLNQVKVVILGQDPYHNEGQAMGMSFSVPEGYAIPPSLNNIYEELVDDEEIKSFIYKPTSGSLVNWAEQGVLLINATLTVEAHKPNSHAKYGWQQFTDNVIKTISDKCSGVVFLLMGNFAHTKEKLVDESKHSVIKTAHPSSLSFTKWFKCRCFSKVNTELKKFNKSEIDWTV